MPGRNLLILGGTGFLGHHLLPRLAQLGYRATVPSRNRIWARELALIPDVALINADIHDPAVLTQLVAGKDAIINLVGILNEDGQQRFESVHRQLVEKLVAACKHEGVDRVLQLSALRASDGVSEYLRSRGRADQALRQSSLAWTVLESAPMFGAGGGLNARFAGLLGMLPILPLPRPQARMTPVAVEDVAQAVVRCLADKSTRRLTLQLAGPENLALIDIVRAIARAMGKRRWILPMPDALGSLQARLAGLVPGKPFSHDNFLSLKTDSVAATDDLRRLGIAPRDFSSRLSQLVDSPSRAAYFNHLRDELRGFVAHRHRPHVIASETDESTKPGSLSDL